MTLQLKKKEMRLLKMIKTKIRRRVMLTRRRMKMLKRSQMKTNKPNYRHSLMILILKPRRLSKVTLIILKISNLIWWKIIKAVNSKTLLLKNKKKKHSKLSKKLVQSSNFSSQKLDHITTFLKLLLRTKESIVLLMMEVIKHIFWPFNHLRITLNGTPRDQAKMETVHWESA